MTDPGKSPKIRVATREGWGVSALVFAASLSLAACSTGPTPDQPTSPEASATASALPAPSSTPSAVPSARTLPGGGAYAPLDPCMVSDEEIGEALGLAIVGHYHSDFGYEGEYLCTYLIAAGTELEVYIFPPVDHRNMGIGGTVMDQENRPAPEEQPIVVEGATDVHGYLAFPGIDVRFETDQGFVLLRTHVSSDREGLDKTVAVANLIADALATKTPS